MLKQLEKLLKEKAWGYQVLRDNLYQKEAIYFVLGNEEVVVLKHQDELLKYYLEVIKEW